MKSMIKILARYIGSAAGIALILLTLNIALLFFWLMAFQQENGYAYRVSEVAKGLQKQGNQYTLSETAKKAMNTRYEWGMLLNEQGRILWSMNLPKELFKNYTVPEVAGFTKWYLEDYPVYVWRHNDGLLVMGCPKGSVWKTDFQMPQKVMDKTLVWIPLMLSLNGLAAVLLALMFGMRLFRSFRLLADGIEKMAKKQAVELPANGILGDLAILLNQTSLQLQRQESALKKRDYARTSWIAGISHDIRTPLSMVMGYASQLEENVELSPSGREQAVIIRKQSERIKTLVEDLNLASKLEYDMQPLDKSEMLLAPLVRKVLADFLNGGLSEIYSIDVQLDSSVGNIKISGDEKLLKRAVFNLIDNSVQHNPQGCDIKIMLCRQFSHCILSVADNGSGFSKEALKQLNQKEIPAGIPSHGLGLTIVRQIIKVHEGTVEFKNLPSGGCEAVLTLPC